MNQLRNIWNKITDRKLYRYYGAVLVFALMVVILLKCMDGTIADTYPEAGVYQDYSETADQELESLITKYYEYYAAGDTDKLETIAYPLSYGEKSYIQFFSAYVEKYENIKLYTKRGLDDTSYLVSAYIEIKFNNIETPAPGLDFFYVKTDKDGNMYIDNTYSSYNTSNGDYEMDPDIASLIATFEQQDDVLALQAEVQQSFNEAVIKDDDLYSFVNVDFPALTSQWAQEYQTNLTAWYEAEEKNAEEAAAKAKEEQEAATKEALSTAIKDAADQYKTNATNVKIRSEASTDGDQLAILTEKGTTVYVIASAGDWSQIFYEDGETINAYIKTEFLDFVKKGSGSLTDATAAATADDDATADDADATEETDEDTDETEETDDAEETAATDTGFTAGDTVTLTHTTKIRKAMSTDSDVVKTIYSGESVEVVMSYAEGWTKVTYGNKEGYIRNDVLN